MIKIYASLLSLLIFFPLYAGEQLAEALLQQRGVEVSARVRERVRVTRERERATLRCLCATWFAGGVLTVAAIGTGFALYSALSPLFNNTKDKPTPEPYHRFLRIIGPCGSCQYSQITSCIQDRLANETQAYEKGIINAACSRNRTWTEWGKMYDGFSTCESLPTAMDKIKTKCGNHTGAVPTSTITLRDKLKTKRRLMADRRAGKGI